MNQMPHQQLVKLDQWSLMSVTGEDAIDFLQNQLTNSVKTLPLIKPEEMVTRDLARLAGYCSPKGRLMASFWMSRHQVEDASGSIVPQIRLFVSNDLIAPITKRLSMYVLRSKAKVTDLSDHTVCFGYSYDETVPTTSHQELLSQLIKIPGANILELPPVTTTTLCWRYLMSIHKEHETKINDLRQQYAVNGSVDIWNWLEVLSAIPRITSKTYEQFVPQMINMESLKGVDFQKGCYPGQEIVARSQYRGTIKRRLQLALIQHSVLPEIGTEIFHSGDPTQPCGMVVLAAHDPLKPSQISLQVECKLEALETGSVHLGDASGPILSFQALPYPLVEI
jgi:folate-binding protein YgfZ